MLISNTALVGPCKIPTRDGSHEFSDEGEFGALTFFSLEYTYWRMIRTKTRTVKVTANLFSVVIICIARKLSGRR